MFTSLLRKTRLDDTEFLVNLGDWPLSDKQNSPIAFFSWCGSPDTYDIILPTYELTESVLHAQGRILNDVLGVFGRQSTRFSEKTNKLFWRGRDSHKARLKLLQLAKNHEDLFNVSITNWFFFREQMHEYGVDPQSSVTNQNYTTLMDFFQYRYQLNLDGTVAAYRFPFLLSSNSLVIKQDSKYYEYFYAQLQQGKHYLSVDEDLDSLTNLVECLIREQCSKQLDVDVSATNVERIIWHARRFVLATLLPEHIYCYIWKALESYTKMMKSNGSMIALRDGVQLVNDDNGGHQQCQCDTQSPQSTSGWGGDKLEL